MNCYICSNQITSKRLKRHPTVKTCSSKCSAEMEKQASKQRMYERRYLYAYGLTRDQFNDILIGQDNKCAICQVSFGDETKSKPYMDHDHACCPRQRNTCGKCIRGVLCQKCNIFVARVEEGLVEPALAYLEKYSSI